MADTGSSRKPKQPRKKLLVDLTEMDEKILEALDKLNQKCIAWASSPQKTTPQFSYDMTGKHLHDVMDTNIHHTYALHDYSALAVRSIKAGSRPKPMPTTLNQQWPPP